MSERILLSSYSIKIKNNKDFAYLSAFNDVDDFYNVLEKFLDFILKNVNELTDRSGEHKIYLTLEEKPKFLKKERVCYGYFSSGISGEDYKIKELATNTTLLNVNRANHASFRDVFFYFYIPQNKSLGYLILQRKKNFGIKTKLHPALNSFLMHEGYVNNYLTLQNIIHISVYQQMMKLGKLKKVELVKNKIPDSLEDYVNNDQNYKQTKGTFRTSFSSRISLPETWKTYIDNLMRKEPNETVEIDGLDDNFTELEFQLDLNGKQKTFYIKNRHRVQPDIDVTNSIEFENDIPKTESLAQNSKELIDDILNLAPKNA